MQNFNKFNDSDYISDAPDKLNDNFETIASDFAGTSFPTTDLVEGMICYRTDKNEVYRYDGNSWQLEYTIVDGGIKAKQADSASSATSAGKATNDANGKAITGYVADVTVGSAQGKIKVTDGAGKSTEFTSYTIATQAEAKTGTDNTKVMTPLRTKEAFDKNFSDRKLEEATERIENIYVPVDDGFIGMKIEGGGTIFFDYMLGYKYGSLAVAPVTSNLHSYHIDKDRNIVVCDDPNDTTKQHRFYVVSDYDIGDYKHGENLMWADTASASMYNILVGTETGFGKGYSNTEKCIAAASADNRLEWNANAYNMIWHYVWKGDWLYRSPKWFVPSKDELNVLLNMQWHEAARRVSYDGTVKMKQLPINFYSYYWSSSESSATVAHGANFCVGDMTAHHKPDAGISHVRLCRTF